LASSAASVIGMGAWFIGQVNQQIFSGKISGIPYLTNNFGDFAYGIFPQVGLAILISSLDIREKLSPLLKSPKAGTLLRFSPEIFAIFTTSLLVAQEIIPFLEPFIKPDHKDIPAAIMGGLIGYLGIGRRLKRFLGRKIQDQNLTFWDNLKIELAISRPFR
jgi:hypothetical protein